MRDLDWKILTTLYQNKNITKTANLFFISQPTLTKRIQSMEEELNTQLLIRNTKGVNFTPKGEMVVRYGEQILRMIEELKEKLSESGQWDVGTLKIGISGSVANYVIPGFLTGFSSRHPKLHAEITDYLSGDTIDYVSEKKLDLGFICTEVFSSHISKYFLRKEPCYLVSKDLLRLEDLPSLPRIFTNQNDHSNMLMQNWWSERFAAPPLFGFRARSGDMAVQMIREGICYGLIFYRGKGYFEERGLHAEPLYYLDGSPVARNCWLIYHKSREEDPLIRHFMEEIQEYDFNTF